MFRLIRVRLVLSYAGIALLTTLALGTVLLFTLRAYYAQTERAYLNNNARTIGNLAAPMLVQKVSKDVQDAQTTNLAFLSQARVRILDANKNVLADSGPWQTTSVGLGVLRSEKVMMTTEGTRSQAGSSVIVIQGSPLGSETLSNIKSKPAQPPEMTAEANGGPGPNVTYFSPGVSVSAGVYGLSLGEKEAAISTARSGQQVLSPIHDTNGALLGYVELSEGPAYGREIVRSVAVGLGLSGGLAILLAIVAGWLTSRRFTAPLLDLTQATEQMSSGDLSVRVVEAGRTDEFGVLGKSFNQMAGRIEETIQTLRRFLSDAAHELQTPLTALRTNLELARSEANSADADQHLGLALEQIDRLQRLIKDLLNLSRLESANGDEDFQPVDLRGLVRQTSEPFAARAEQAGQDFDIDLPQDEAFVTGSPEKLRGALANLLDNALKFTPAGGAVTVHLREDQEAYLLTVSDTGIGIPPEEIEMLFNRFHRARNASAYPGSGLGLAIVRTIIQAHGGSVQATNNPQGGASFTLVLPRAQPGETRPGGIP